MGDFLTVLARGLPILLMTKYGYGGEKWLSEKQNMNEGAHCDSLYLFPA
jgi:hypothetical protein